MGWLYLSLHALANLFSGLSKDHVGDRGESSGGWASSQLLGPVTGFALSDALSWQVFLGCPCRATCGYTPGLPVPDLPLEGRVPTSLRCCHRPLALP